MENNKKKPEPGAVAKQFDDGTNLMNSIGKKGIAEQSKINERMYVGDQWYGVKVGNRPLVRRNIIGRIGKYKIATLVAAPIAVNYSADGIPTNHTIDEAKTQAREMLLNGESIDNEPEEISGAVAMSVLSDYFSTTAERLKFNDKCEEAVRNAYISGTGITYTYWDSSVKTGLYADERKNTPIKGDIGFEVLDVENVRFGDPNNPDVQSQPYIIVAQRKYYEDIRREAKRNGMPKDVIEQIKPDRNYSDENAGERGGNELSSSKRVTVYTKFWKDYNEDGSEYTLKAYRCTKTVTVKDEWELGVKLYPFAKLCWDRRRSCAYGDSEITYLVPNQIAINRAYTAMMWQIMLTGLPLTLVNGDIVSDNITGDPGEQVRIYGSSDDMLNAIRYVNPPNFAPQMQNTIAELTQETLTDSGATDAALGQARPDNASALIQMREAALQPMQVYQNRYYSFIEDIARIWADFWLNKYGTRKLRIGDDNDNYYVTFNAEHYKNLVINAKIDVGATTLWNTAVVISTLDSLLQAKVITPIQYLKRVPNGLIPDKSGLIKDMEASEMARKQTSDSALLDEIKRQEPELYEEYMRLPPEERQEMLQKIKQRAGIDNESGQTV